MKNTLKNTIIAIAIIASPLATFAAQEGASKKAYNLPTYTIEDIAALPKPSHNPIPSVKSQYVGMNLKVRLTVNAEGKAENVKLDKPLISYSDVEKMTFANRLQEKVKTWRFEPAMDNAGNAISVKVILPVQVVEKGNKVTALASLLLDTTGHDRS